MTYELPDRYVNTPLIEVSRSVVMTGVNSNLSPFPFDTANFNEFGCYNFGTQRFTCPEAGRYLFSANFSVQQETGTATFGILAGADGGFSKRLCPPVSSTAAGQWVQLSGSYYQFLDVGQTVFCSFLYFFGTGTLRIAEAGQSYFSICKIQ